MDAREQYYHGCGFSDEQIEAHEREKRYSLNDMRRAYFEGLLQMDEKVKSALFYAWLNDYLTKFK